MGKKPAGKKSAGENRRGKDLAGKRPAGERPSGDITDGEKTVGNRPAGKVPVTVLIILSTSQTSKKSISLTPNALFSRPSPPSDILYDVSSDNDRVAFSYPTEARVPVDSAVRQFRIRKYYCYCLLVWTFRNFLFFFKIIRF